MFFKGLSLKQIRTIFGRWESDFKPTIKSLENRNIISENRVPFNE